MAVGQFLCPCPLLEHADGAGFISLFSFVKAGLTGGTEPKGGAKCGCSTNKVQNVGVGGSAT